MFVVLRSTLEKGHWLQWNQNSRVLSSERVGRMVGGDGGVGGGGGE